jgi:feruloyl esterase
MQHYSDGVYNAPWYITGSSQSALFNQGTHSVPGFADSNHDALLALMDWVENGKAVEKLVATKFRNKTISMGVQSQGPLCTYPQELCI